MTTHLARCLLLALLLGASPALADDIVVSAFAKDNREPIQATVTYVVGITVAGLWTTDHTNGKVTIQNWTCATNSSFTAAAVGFLKNTENRSCATGELPPWLFERTEYTFNVQRSVTTNVPIYRQAALKDPTIDVLTAQLTDAVNKADYGKLAVIGTELSQKLAVLKYTSASDDAATLAYDATNHLLGIDARLSKVPNTDKWVFSDVSVAAIAKFQADNKIKVTAATRGRLDWNTLGVISNHYTDTLVKSYTLSKTQIIGPTFRDSTSITIDRGAFGAIQ